MNWPRHMAVTHRHLMRSPREMWSCTPQGVCISHVFIQLSEKEGRGGEGEG